MYKIFGACTLEIWEGQKSNIRGDLGQLSTLTANILEIYRDIKNREQIWSTTISAGFSQKSDKLRFTNKKVISTHTGPP